MAERKSGPVKPPVIDLTARPADKPETATSGKPDEAATTAAPSKPEASGEPAAKSTAEPAAKPADTSTAKSTGATATPSASSQARTTAGAARTSDSATPPPKSSGRPEPGTPPKSAPARPAFWGPVLAGGLIGALVGVAASYGLATAGLWPGGTSSDQLDQLRSRLTELETASAADKTALAAVNTHLGGLESDFAARMSAASNALEDVKTGLAKAEGNKTPAVDLTPLENQIKTLTSRVDAVAAGASSADAGALAANLATVQQDVTKLSGRLDALTTRAGATDQSIASLKSELDSAKAAIDKAASAPSPATIASAMQLPLLISALEADFSTGRPYATDLQALTAAVPETHVPAAISDAAATGLPAPDDLTRAFEAKMPDIIAARPARANPDWQSQITDWLSNALALRREGVVSGDTPDAILSRLEDAVRRHDFAGASKLVTQLPKSMQDAMGSLAKTIADVASAEAFITSLRTNALAAAGGAAK